LVLAGGNTLHSEICILINSIWNKEELPQQWNESIIVAIYKKGDKTYCSNCRGLAVLPTKYKILSDILVSRLIPHVQGIIGGDQCGFRRNGSTTDQIFCTRLILEAKGEGSGIINYESMRREVLYNTLI
jgi:hypothetical protein